MSEQTINVKYEREQNETANKIKDLLAKNYLQNGPTDNQNW